MLSKSYLVYGIGTPFWAQTFDHRGRFNKQKSILANDCFPLSTDSHVWWCCGRFHSRDINNFHVNLIDVATILDFIQRFRILYRPQCAQYSSNLAKSRGFLIMVFDYENGFLIFRTGIKDYFQQVFEMLTPNLVIVIWLMGGTVISKILFFFSLKGILKSGDCFGDSKDDKLTLQHNSPKN